MRSAESWKVPQWMPTAYIAPSRSNTVTASGGSIWLGAIILRGSYDPIGISAKRTGPWAAAS